MRAAGIHIRNFRNHSSTSLNFGAGVNVLVGNNGQGKTNVLEAISCLCLTKSFYAANDATLVQLGQQAFDVEATLTNDDGNDHAVSLIYTKESGEKVCTVNNARVDRLASLIGMFPVVILSPEKGAITQGGPADRRRFMDMVLSQLSRSYFDDLLEYRRILRQRNRVLSDGKQRGGVRQDVLDPWNQSLAEHGERIILRRTSFVAEFARYLVHSYADLVEINEEPELEYSTFPNPASRENGGTVAEALLAELRHRQAEEIRRGLSLVGPHRDDLVFRLNGIDLQRYASQGQHKTFLVALKAAEYEFLKEKKNEAPILLLDDVLSELDESRSRRLINHVAGLGQTIITTTEEAPFNDAIPWGYEHRKFNVAEGACTPVSIRNGKEATVGV